MLVSRTITVFPQPSTELILSYKGSSLKRAAGIAGEREIAKPTKLANYFLLQYLRWAAQNYAKAKAAVRNFYTLGKGAENSRVLRLTRNPKWSNAVAGCNLDFFVLIVSAKHSKIVKSKRI